MTGYSLRELASYSQNGHAPSVDTRHWQLIDPDGNPVIMLDRTIVFETKDFALDVVEALNDARLRRC